MNDLKNLFQQISKITELAKERATDIFRLKEWKQIQICRVATVEFKPASVEVVFTKFDNFVVERIQLDLAMLGMSDQEWIEYMMPFNKKMRLEQKADAEKEEKDRQEYFTKKLKQAQAETEYYQKKLNPNPAQNE